MFIILEILLYSDGLDEEIFWWEWILSEWTNSLRLFDFLIREGYDSLYIGSYIMVINKDIL